MDLEKLLLELIEQKYSEVQKKQKNGIFEKILHFEGNAIGQIGEKFVKEVFRALNLPLDELSSETIRDEFDLLSKESIHYYIIDKRQDYHYNHTLRKEFIRINDKDKQLVMMNPGNQVNLKLTLNLKELKPMMNFVDELRAIF